VDALGQEDVDQIENVPGDYSEAADVMDQDEPQWATKKDIEDLLCAIKATRAEVVTLRRSARIRNKSVSPYTSQAVSNTSSLGNPQPTAQEPPINPIGNLPSRPSRYRPARDIVLKV
jgi:hypothetical protein